MYFKKLEMLGFKSFVDKTVLNFEPGITAVVGPNGCGKSNIFDAIRWVLGEQSVKSLRGSSMEDVIFNGTDKKAGVGFAEVSLTFSNESKIFPIEYDEVTVTRRLFRSGESEYLLNKTQVRLKDILELFMGTGVGAESYSLIEQGKVDLLISSKPEDRRLILDEASGITKYKSKKREALNKLQDTENNLLRINDIILEVKRQIGSIERQASKARRYKEEFEKLKDLEIKASFFELNKLRIEKEGLSAQKSELKDKESKFGMGIEGLNSQILEYNSNLDKFRQELEQVRSADLRGDSAIEMDKHEIEINHERILEAKERSARLGEEKKQSENRCFIQNEKIEKLKLEISSLSDFEINASSLLKEKNALLKGIAFTIKQAEEEIAQSKKSILELTSQNSLIKNDLTEVFSQTQQLLARKRRLEIENSKVSSEKQELESNLQGIRSEIENIQSRINLACAQKQEVTSLRESSQLALKAIGEKIINLERERATLESQEEFIEDLKLQYQEMPSPVKGVLLTSEPPRGNCYGILGRVKEVLPVEDKFKILIDGYLKGDAREARQILCEAKFIELDAQKISQRINEVINLVEGLRQEEGALINEIELKNKEIERWNSQMHQEEILLSNQKQQENNILEQSDKLDAETELIGEELKEAQASLGKINVRDTQLKKQNADLEEQLRLTQNRINSLQELISLKGKEKEETSVILAQTEVEISSFKDKENSLLDNLKIFEETQNRDAVQIRQLEKEVQELVLRMSDLEKQNSLLVQKIKDSLAQKDSLQSKFQQVDQKRAGLLDALKEEESKKGNLEEELQKVINRFHELEMLALEISFKEERIRQRLLQSYQVNLDEFRDISLEAIESELLNNQIAQLKGKIESFGTVNLVAIEEYEELKKRFEFLNLQQADLLSAKEQLHSTISKINRTTKELFLNTFTKVAEEFKAYFKMLFGGGEAQLTLINPEDVLETGIEIVARPPGKKLQSISLLSGGEKALTAIALIFGVFKVNPSPFCILDEIDAALDESNVGRFGYLLKDFSKISQFIVITHNKKTIVNADVMYGITMQETGVSKIVSVKFAEKGKEEAAVSGQNREEVAAVNT